MCEQLQSSRQLIVDAKSASWKALGLMGTFDGKVMVVKGEGQRSSQLEHAIRIGNDIQKLMETAIAKLEQYRDAPELDENGQGELKLTEDEFCLPPAINGYEVAMQYLNSDIRMGHFRLRRLSKISRRPPTIEMLKLDDKTIVEGDPYVTQAGQHLFIVEIIRREKGKKVEDGLVRVRGSMGEMTFTAAQVFGAIHFQGTLAIGDAKKD